MNILDVRTPEEFCLVHAESANNLPLSDIQSGKFPDIDKNEPIAVHCQGGGRSAQAKTLLEKAGFTNVTNLGGVYDLEDHGIKLVTP